jgi:hypothetical protein
LNREGLGTSSRPGHSTTGYSRVRLARGGNRSRRSSVSALRAGRDGA